MYIDKDNEYRKNQNMQRCSLPIVCNYDYIVTNSINSLLISSRCIPNGAHINHFRANLAHASKYIKKSFQTKFTSTHNNISVTSTSSNYIGSNVNKFMGEHTPYPLRSSVFRMVDCSSLNKTPV